MRNYLFVLTMFFSLSISAQEIQLSWKKDFNVAREQAKSENKPILVYFTKTGCEGCQEFYTEFFKQKDFTLLADDFVLLMLNGSDHNENTTDISIMTQRRLTMHYNKASSYPALLVLDPLGKEIGDILTSTDKTATASYLEFLKTL
ncbi:MAG TPA: thioredoxin family protein [Aquaticitalea sp.]|nr:thioredoxin family protein [Aquaticitalea sp.]